MKYEKEIHNSVFSFCNIYTTSCTIFFHVQVLDRNMELSKLINIHQSKKLINYLFTNKNPKISFYKVFTT